MVALALAFLLLPFAFDEQLSKGVAGLLPPGAKIVETADISTTAGKPRMLVLWMMYPVRQSTGPEYCGTAVYGTLEWKGPARLSLVDSGNWRLINTIRVHSGCPGCVPSRPDDLFLLPSVSKALGSYYSVPRPGKDGTGIPRILTLRDYTGNGVVAEFPVFEYEACGIVNTSLLGYQPGSDTVVQYTVEPGGFWVEQVFARRPVRPGHWKFTWAPGHGVDDIVDVDLFFDREKQVFIDKSTVRVPGN